MGREHGRTEGWRLSNYISFFHVIKNLFKNPALFNRYPPPDL